MFGRSPLSRSAVFKCELLSVTQDTSVYEDCSKQVNIFNIPIMSVGTIMVQPTHDPRYFREIITKKLIPVFREREFINPRNNTSYIVPTKPYFIKYKELINHGEYSGNSLEIAQAEEVKKYIEQHTFPHGSDWDFSLDLDEKIFLAEKYYANAAKANNATNAETYYANVAKGNNVTNAKVVKKLVKDMRNKQSW